MFILQFKAAIPDGVHRQHFPRCYKYTKVKLSRSEDEGMLHHSTSKFPAEASLPKEHVFWMNIFILMYFLIECISCVLCACWVLYIYLACNYIRRTLKIKNIHRNIQICVHVPLVYIDIYLYQCFNINIYVSIYVCNTQYLYKHMILNLYQILHILVI